MTVNHSIIAVFAKDDLQRNWIFYIWAWKMKLNLYEIIKIVELIETMKKVIHFKIKLISKHNILPTWRVIICLNPISWTRLGINACHQTQNLEGKKQSQAVRTILEFCSASSVFPCLLEILRKLVSLHMVVYSSGPTHLGILMEASILKLLIFRIIIFDFNNI